MAPYTSTLSPSTVLLKWGLCVTHVLLLEIFYSLSACIVVELLLQSGFAVFLFYFEALYYQFPKYKSCLLTLLEKTLAVTTSLFEIHPCPCFKGEGDLKLIVQDFNTHS